MTGPQFTGAPVQSRPNLARWLGVATLGSWLVLAVTGVLLGFLYQPPQTGGTRALQGVHIAAGALALVGPVALLAVHALSNQWRGLVGAVGLFLVACGGWLTAQFIGWDQLGLWAVTVGTDKRGFGPLFGDEVRLVIVDGAELSAATVRNYVILHAVALPILALLFGAMARSRHALPGHAVPSHAASDQNSDEFAPPQSFDSAPSSKTV